MSANKMASVARSQSMSEPTKPFFTGWWAVIVMLLFSLLMVAPVIVNTVSPVDLEEASENEGRRLAELPNWLSSWQEWLKFPKATEEFVNDHLGFRQNLLTAHHQAKMAINISPTKGAIAGKENWLFFGEEYERNDIRGFGRLTLREKQMWRSHLNRIHDRLKEMGIPFLFVIAPDKSSIYPEYLPSNLQPSRKERLDDLMQWLVQSNCRANILNLRDVLVDHKTKYALPTYYRDDTHWNDLGAAIGVQSMINAINKIGGDLPAIDVNEDSFKVTDVGSRDLSKIVRQYSRTESSYRLVNPLFKNYQKSEISPKIQWLADALTETQIRHAATINPSGKGNLLVIRDSFFEGAIPFLSSVAHTCNYLSGFPTTSEIIRAAEDIRPDAVVFELVERNLARMPSDPLLPDDPQSFDEAGQVMYAWGNKLPSDHIKISGKVKDIVYNPSGSNGMSMVLDDSSVLVRIRDIPLSKPGEKILKVRLHAPADTRFRVFTKQVGEKKANQDSKVIKLAKQGWNTFYIDLPDEPMADELILDPGDELGAYELSDIVLKSLK